MASTPAQLIESTTRHSAHVERLKSHDAKILSEMLADIETSLLGRLARNDITKWGMARAETQLTSFRAMLNDRYSSSITPELNRQVKELGVYEAGFEVRNLTGVAPNYSFTIPSESQIMSAINLNPLAITGPNKGKLLEPFIKDWTDSQIDRSIGVIRAGFAQGSTTATVLAELSNDTFPINQRGLATMVRTSLQHSAVQAREQTWKANSDIVKKVRWLSTLDSRTSTICQSLSGQEFPVNSGPRPPAHLDCRSSVVGVLDDRFKVLEKGCTQSSRDPVTGKVTSSPANQTYYGWLKGQPAQVQDSIIGPTRGKLLRGGGLTSQRFAELQLGKTFSPLTLVEMEKLEPLAFIKAGLTGED